MTDPTLVPVAVACQCPGAPHDGDTVYLRPKISLPGGIIAQQSIIEAPPTVGAQTAGLIDAFLRNEIVAWSFVDEKGNDLPVTPANVEARILSDFAYAMPIADVAAELYTEAVINPLRAAASESSKRSRTNGLTSAPKASSPKRQKQPKSSSTPTSPMGDIELTSV